MTLANVLLGCTVLLAFLGAGTLFMSRALLVLELKTKNQGVYRALNKPEILGENLLLTGPFSLHSKLSDREKRYYLSYLLGWLLCVIAIVWGASFIAIR